MIDIIKNNVLVRGWESVSVKLSLSTLCNGFSLSQFVGDNFDSPVLFPGDAVRIESDGELLLDGYVDELNSSFTSGSHTISVSGREKTCDMVDCSMKDFGKSWKNRTVSQIVGEVCGAFGISFGANGVKDNGKIVKFCPDPGCTGADVITDVCRQKDVVCFSDGSGTVKLVNEDKFEIVEDFLRQGVNVLSADVSFSNSERFSDYVVLCSSDPKTKRRGESKDSEIKRTRCMVLIDEGYGSVDAAEQRASFESLSRSAKSTTLNVTVSGWKRNDGKLWKPGVLVDCLMPAFFGQWVQTLLVNEVELSYDSSGTFAHLQLVRKDYYTQPPTKKKKGKADPWSSIRAKTLASEAKK